VLQVIAALIRNGSRVLIARRPPGDRLAGKWEFPGGTVEPGETPEQALRRELAEELGIDASVGASLGSVEHRSVDTDVHLSLYEVTGFSGDIHAFDHAEVRWVALAELDQYDFAPADRPFVARLAKVPAGSPQ